MNQSQGKRKQRAPAQRSASTELELVTADSSPSATVSDSVTVADRWERFWSTYPRKVGKHAARKAWDRARRKRDPDEIQAALESHVVPWASFEQQFIPHPATWLNEGRYDDPPPKPRATNSKPNRVDENMARIQASMQRMEAHG